MSAPSVSAPAVAAPAAGVPDPARLAVLAGWEAQRLAGAVHTLEGVADRLPSWRFRLESLGRSLESAQVWSGPAAAAAARVLLAVSAVTTAVATAFDASCAAYRHLVREADAAAERAAEALALLDERTTGVPGPGLAVADEALRHAAQAAAAAVAAGEALHGLGVRYAFVGGDFDVLARAIAPAPLPAFPVAAAPEELAAWWVALPATVQRRLVRAVPAAVGAADGLPSWARDAANRRLLARALREPEPSGTARAVDRQLAELERDGVPAALLLFDEAGERVALAVGDTDAADAVVLLVPGIGTTPEDDLGAVTDDVRRVVAAAAAPGAAVAGVAWLGYRPPWGTGILLRRRARAAGPVLDAALDGLVAARQAVGTDPARTTVLAHSYGSVVVGEAAGAPGRLAADAVVLLGSPGMRPGADRLEAGEVYHAASVADPISWSSWFGPSPWASGYGSTALPAGGVGHSEYLDADGPTLAAVGAVVGGGRGR